MLESGVWTLASSLLLFVNTYALVGENSEQFHQEGTFQLVNEGDQLVTDVISNSKVRSLMECGQQCLRDDSCIFHNYKSSSNLDDEINCQLLNKTATAQTYKDHTDWKLYRLLNPCTRNNACKNGGNCIEDLSNPRGYYCRCDRPYIGELCEIGPEITCTALKRKNPALPSGFYAINPEGDRYPPFDVYCNMTLKNEVGVTVVSHDSEARTKVDGYGSRGSYSRKITYSLTMEQIIAIMNVSKQCEQFIELQCNGSPLNYNGKQNTWWVSRDGAQMKYWGGAAPDSAKCACGMTNTCAGGKVCNCDMNDDTLREDSGSLTDKTTLPVSELRIGDTGTQYGEGWDEFVFYRLGKLFCWDSA